MLNVVNITSSPSIKLIIYNVNTSLTMGIGKPTSKTLVNRAGVLLSQRSLQCTSPWSTATLSSSARVAHPPNVAAIPGNVPCMLLLMTFNSSNIHVKGS